MPPSPHSQFYEDSLGAKKAAPGVPLLPPAVNKALRGSAAAGGRGGEASSTPGDPPRTDLKVPLTDADLARQREAAAARRRVLKSLSPPDQGRGGDRGALTRGVGAVGTAAIGSEGEGGNNGASDRLAEISVDATLRASFEGLLKAVRLTEDLRVKGRYKNI